uniref:ribonucleoside-diphosphate reductase n=1 Tax=viral metagenome TaxID=1070528 RepID=A0A6C0ET10_9ZZZZ
MSSPKSMVEDEEMLVKKRNGNMEVIAFDKILRRIKTIGTEVGIKINYTTLAMKVIDQLYNGISTTQIDELSAQQCASLASTHPDYNVLASRITISNHHKNTADSFCKVMTELYEYKDKHGQQSPLVSQELYDVVQKYGSELESMLDYSRDYLIDYFGFKTLERAYLMKINKETVERPQHMWLRVAVGIHGDNLEKVKETYDCMSQKYFTHATPTLFNAGTPHPQLSSCYLISMENDSIEGIYNTLKDCALISKWAGGIGLHIHNVRASGSHIRGTNGASNGIVPMLRVFNNTARYVDQCVLPETIIYTTQGPIQIQHCIMNETEIYNLQGDVEVIQNVLEHPYDGEVLEIETMHSIHPLTITPEHPVFVLRGQKKGLNYKVIKNRLEKNICNLEWIDAKDMDIDDMVVYPIPSFSKDIANISTDDCYIYGVILGDGSMSNKTDTSGYISLHTTNKKHITDFIINYFNDRCVDYKIEVDNNTTRIRWNRCIHLPFRYNDFYDENKEKRMLSKWLNLPIEKSKYILKGLLDTDGCIKNELVLDSTSYNLIECTRFLAMKMGVLTSGYIRNRIGESHETVRGIIKNKKISYVLRIPKTVEICDLMDIPYDDKQFFKFLRYNDVLLSRVQKITTHSYNGILYDLQMKNEHNYLLHNGIVHNGGGKRNGSFAIYLEPWHADIEMFLQMRKNHGDEELKARDLFYALWIPDLFMERVKSDGTWTLMCPDECPGLSDVYGEEFNTLYRKYEEGDKTRKTVKARELWFQILDAQMETGTPYLLYKDACNKKSNQKNIGTIKSSNLCVAPETTILTDKGHLEIKSLEGQFVNVWNGEEFSNIQVFKTGENQELIDVYTSDGCKVTCTKYHKFFIQNSYSKKSITTVEAKDLKPNDKIMKCEYPVIDGKQKMLYPYTHGFFCGDGTYGNKNEETSRCKFKCLDGHYYCKRHIDYETEHSIDKLQNDESIDKNRCNGISYEKKPLIYLYDEKKKLLEHMDYRGTYENKNRTVLQLPLDIEEKFFVPMNNTLKDKMEWFSGYCDADGCILNNQNNQQLQISSISKDFLTNTKLMLQTCGINPKIRQMRDHATSYLPDGKGGSKYFDTKPVFRLLITSCDLIKLVNIGFKPKRLVIHDLNLPNRSANQFVKIEKIVDEGRTDDTYCFTEPLRHAGIFNGILTSQCTEILEYSDDKETAVCNLASIALPAFIDKTVNPPVFNYEKLHEISKIVTYNLNRIIDVNFYPTPKTELSNKRHRPIGIGIQGLADVFMQMNLPFACDEAKQMNKQIFETIYHAALERSCEIAKVEGPYETFEGSPAHKGELQFDMWGVEPCTQRYNWAQLKEDIKTNGLRNSLLLAPMPTASTSQILGYNECIEPITSNIYSRRTIAGEFILANKYLMNDLIALDLWNEKMKNNIIANHGSIQHIDFIPEEIREKYKTVWEIPMRNLIDMAADRGAYICQSQSLNLWLEDPNYSNLTSMHFYSWSKGLKTGIYYLRRRGRHQAQQFTIEPEKNNTTREEDEICEICSS